jgi:hypothetical protein
MTARVTGVQLAAAIFAAFLGVAREVLGPREYVVFLDLIRRRLERELERQGRARGRWVA